MSNKEETDDEKVEPKVLTGLFKTIHDIKPALCCNQNK